MPCSHIVASLRQSVWQVLHRHMDDQARRREDIPSVSRVLPDGRIVELVYDGEEKATRFAVCQEGSVSFHDAIDDAGRRLVPLSPENNLLRHGAVLLSECPEPYGSVEELLNEIEAYLYRYVDLSKVFFRIASSYILLTWVYDAFNELPYLRLRGDYGSGKTRALLILGSISYKPFFASGSSTVSPIFHTLDTFRGTLIFDEADFRFSDEKAELVKIFNNGNVRGFPVLRTAVTKAKEFDPRAFAVYGPKIVAMRREFADQALESRFITEEMGQRSLRADIPINLPEVQKEEAQILRNKLLQYRFDNLGKVNINEALVDQALSPRLNQILVPLLSIIDDETRKREIREAAEVLERELRVEKSSSIEGELLEILVALTAEKRKTSIPLSDITRRFIEQHGIDFVRPITNRYIGHVLRKRLRLHLYKSHGVYVLPLMETGKIQVLARRYGVIAKDADE